jgi:hypothetical protein
MRFEIFIVTIILTWHHVASIRGYQRLAGTHAVPPPLWYGKERGRTFIRNAGITYQTTRYHNIFFTEGLETITSTRIKDNPTRDSNPIPRRYKKCGMPGKKSCHVMSLVTPSLPSSMRHIYCVYLRKGNKQVYNSYTTLQKVMTSRRMRLQGHIALIGKKRNE